MQFAVESNLTWYLKEKASGLYLYMIVEDGCLCSMPFSPSYSVITVHKNLRQSGKIDLEINLTQQNAELLFNYFSKAYYLGKTSDSQQAYLLISSMYVICSCSKFTPILFCITC